MDDGYKKYEPFFGKWKYRGMLGKGTFGQVFEIYRDDGRGGIITSALKYIHIPTEDALREQLAEQPNKDAVRKYFSRQVERIKEEIRILINCKDQSNIVNYEEHRIEENVGEYGIGWDILIRMELLQPLEVKYPKISFFSREQATQYEVLEMWRDIANALVYCEDQSIIHRDIKPANILRSEDGKFKLSDFGVARKTIQNSIASTRVGTERYMAPEVFKNEKYDKRADYYSLGCVVYYYLNHRRHVFMPPYPQETSSDDIENAERKRISGEKIPRIEGVSREIDEVLRKSMAYRPANRYRSARELLHAVQDILNTQEGELRRRFLNDTGAAREQASLGGRTGGRGSYISTGGAVQSEGLSGTPKKKKRKKTRLLIPTVLAGFMLAAGVGGVCYGLYLRNDGRRTTAGNAVANEAAAHVESGLATAEKPADVRPDAAEPAGTDGGENPPVVVEIKPKPEEELESVTELKPKEEPEFVTGSKPEEEPESVTEPKSEEEPESVTEPKPEEEPESVIEPKPEEEPESVTEPKPEEEPESVTELKTEAVNESKTEAVIEPETMSETQSEPETEPRTETEMPVPTTRLLGELERPKEDDVIDSEIKAKGWILANDTVGEISAYLDLLSGGTVVSSYELEQKDIGGNTFEKRKTRYAADIAAASGCEVRGSFQLEGVADGDYSLQLRAVDSAGGGEEILQTVPVRVAGKENSGDVMDFLGMNEETQKTETHYIYEDKGFAVGVDLGEDDGIRANPEQILLTGWINAEEGTSIGMYLDIDSEIYTADSLAEQGGSFEILRVPRNLEKLDREMIGSFVPYSDEAGYVVNLSVPFLEAGEHTIAISLNVGVPGQEPELVDIRPFTLNADPSVRVNESAVEQITDAWEKEFPEPQTTGSEAEEQEKETGE